MQIDFLLWSNYRQMGSSTAWGGRAGLGASPGRRAARHPSNERFPVICISLRSRTHYRVTGYQSHCGGQLGSGCRRLRESVAAVPRAPVGSGEGKPRLGPAAGSRRAPVGCWDCGFSGLPECL